MRDQSWAGVVIGGNPQIYEEVPNSSPPNEIFGIARIECRHSPDRSTLFSGKVTILHLKKSKHFNFLIDSESASYSVNGNWLCGSTRKSIPRKTEFESAEDAEIQFVLMCMNAAFGAIRESFEFFHMRMCWFLGNNQTYVCDTCVKCVLERREPDEQFFDLMVSLL